MGHCVGDQVLREVAKNLQSMFRAFDTLARLGGDEFTMIASDIREDRSLERLLTMCGVPSRGPYDGRQKDGGDGEPGGGDLSG